MRHGGLVPEMALGSGGEAEEKTGEQQSLNKFPIKLPIWGKVNTLC
jgi:hypothetical protein